MKGGLVLLLVVHSFQNIDFTTIRPWMNLVNDPVSTKILGKTRKEGKISRKMGRPWGS